jgi:hypothetical protein
LQKSYETLVKRKSLKTHGLVWSLFSLSEWTTFQSRNWQYSQFGYLAKLLMDNSADISLKEQQKQTVEKHP